MIARVLATTADPSKDMADIFGRPEFRRTPSWWDRITSWFGDIADHLSFSWLGSVGQFLLWLLLVAAVVALVWWVRRKLSGRSWRRRRSTDADEVVPIDLDGITDPGALRSAVAAYEEERDYKQAILFRYRELVMALMAARSVSTEPGRTTGELRLDVAASTPAATPSFDAATDIFEVTWFSDHPPTPAEFDRLDRHVTDTLAAAGIAPRPLTGASS